MTCCCSPAEPRMLGGGTVPASCPGSQWPFPSSGKCGHACARAPRNLPQFQPRPGSTRAKGREAAGEGCLGVPGKLCHPREAVSPSALSCHWPRCRGVASPGECLPRVCWNVCPGSCRQKQVLVALGLLLATLWGGDEECGGIRTCPLHPKVPALASSTFPAPV